MLATVVVFVVLLEVEFAMFFQQKLCNILNHEKCRTILIFPDNVCKKKNFPVKFTKDTNQILSLYLTLVTPSSLKEQTNSQGCKL